MCALYVPGVAFSDPEQLKGVTLFEMPYTKWGAKVSIFTVTSVWSLSVIGV